MKDRKVIQTLATLEQAHGVLRAEDVVTAATPPESPLHSYFEWDDSTAAQEYRLVQARRLIREAVEYIDIDGSTQLIPIYCSLKIDREEDGGGYRNLRDVLAVPAYRDQLLETALDDLRHFQSRYEQFKLLASFKPLRGVFRAVDKATNKKKPPQREGRARWIKKPATE